MTITVNLRAVAAGGALTLALALAPAAAKANATSDATNGGSPGVYVCNEAGMAFVDGTLAVLDPAADPNPPARHKVDLKALPGKGVGLVHAAANSPALALCGTPAPVSPGGDGSGGDPTLGGAGTGTGSGTGGGTGGGPIDIV